MGRFFNVDPLSGSFAYNGVYNFSENRVVDAFELEGLESVVTTDGERDMNADEIESFNELLSVVEGEFGELTGDGKHDILELNGPVLSPNENSDNIKVNVSLFLETNNQAYLTSAPCIVRCHQTPGMDMSGGSGWDNFSIMGNHNETFNSFYTHGPGRKEPFKDPKWLRVGDKIVPVEFDFMTPGSVGRATNFLEVVTQTLELWDNVNGEGGLVDVISNQRNKSTDADDSIELRIWTNGIHQDKPDGVLRGHLGPKIYKTTRRDSLKVILQVDKNNDSINNILSNQ